jgi:hypothetical protein
LSSSVSFTNPTFQQSDGIGFRLASTFSTLNYLNLPDFATIGDNNNLSDTGGSIGKGSVSYTYAIGKYMVTNSDYIEFLRAVAVTDANNLYVLSMASARGGINRSGSNGSYSYSLKTNYADKPVNSVSWFDCARYCNWLHNGKPTGVQDSSTTEDGAYLLNGVTTGNAIEKKAGAKYSLPTENEWYKAAYYKGGGTNAGYWKYATQSDIDPTCVSANSVGDGLRDCNITNVQACTTNEFISGSSTKIGRLTWTPIDAPICSSYTGYSVQVFYTLGENGGQWVGWSWVSSLSTSSIFVNVFPHTGQQRYRIRAQNTSINPTLYTSWSTESNNITYDDGVFCSDINSSPTPTPTPTVTPTNTVTPTPTPSRPPIVGCDHKILKLYIPNSVISPGGNRASSIQLRIGGGTCCSRSNIRNIIIPSLPPPPPPPQPEVCLAAGTDLYGYTAIVSYDPTNCDAGHSCNRAIFDFYINTTLIGQANLNNQNDGGYRESIFTINEHIVVSSITELKLVCKLDVCHNGVGRVVLKNPSNNVVLALCMPNDVAVAGSFICPCPKILGSTHNIAANALNTNIQVNSGSRLTISADGTINIGWPAHPGAYGPDGIPGIGNDPISGFPYVSLLGRIGESGTVFFVGSSYSAIANETGKLYLFFYDPQPSDNTGYFSACVCAVDDSSTNLVLNGDFESGTLGTAPDVGTTPVGALDHWTISKVDIHSLSQYDSSQPVKKWVDLNALSPGYIQQTINTTIGSTYSVTFNLAAHNITEKNIVKKCTLSAIGSSTVSKDYSFDPSATTFGTYESMGWISKGFVFTADSSSTIVKFESSCPSCGVVGAAIDNVVIKLCNNNAPAISPTPTPTVTPTVTPEATSTNTPTPTVTPTVTPEATSTNTPTPTVTPTVTPEATSTNTPTSTVTPTVTMEETPTPTPTVTMEETPTPTPTVTMEETPTPTPTVTMEETPTPTVTYTPTPTPTNDDCANSISRVKMTGWYAGDRILSPVGYAPYGYETYTYGDETVRYETGVWLYVGAEGEITRAYGYEDRPWLANWPTPYAAEKVRQDGTACVSPTPTPTSTETPTPTPTPTMEVPFDPAPTPTVTPTPTATPTNSVTPTVTVTPTNTITPTVTATVTPTPTNTTTPTPTNTVTPTATTAGSGVVGYTVSGNLSRNGTSLAGNYCDTGITNSDGTPIYRCALTDGGFGYLVRSSAGIPGSRYWLITYYIIGNAYSQNASIGTTNIIFYAGTTTPQITPPSTGWTSSDSSAGGSITSIMATTCGPNPTPTPTATSGAIIVGYSVNGNATTVGSSTAGVYCDTGITNSDGVPIYRYSTGNGSFPYNYLIRRAGTSATAWHIVISNSATKFSQSVEYYGDSYVAWTSNNGSGTTPPSTGWGGGFGPPTTGSITSVTATTCGADISLTATPTNTPIPVTSTPTPTLTPTPQPPTTISFTKNNTTTNGCNGNQFYPRSGDFPRCLNDCIITDPLGSDITRDGYVFSVSPTIQNPQGNTTYQWWAISYTEKCSLLSSPIILSSPCWRNATTDTIEFNNGCNGYYKLWCRVTNNGVVADSDVYFFEYNPVV